ncbi:MAG: PRC-barrel domain-containing protein [Ardenticatenaceae bacterium]
MLPTPTHVANFIGAPTSPAHLANFIGAQPGGHQMRRSKELAGKRIITLDNGTNLGIVKDLYFDREANKVMGLFLGYRGQRFNRKARVIPASAVALFGKDVVLVSQADVVREVITKSKFPEWVRRDQLQGRLISAADGTKIGIINDLLINPDGLVKGFALSMIFFQGIHLKEHHTILRKRGKSFKITLPWLGV